MRLFRNTALAVSVPALAVSTMFGSQPARAQQNGQYVYHLPAQSLELSLRAIAARSGRNIGAAASVLAGRTAPALDGAFTTEGAVGRVLAGTDLRYRAVGSDLIIEAIARDSVSESSEERQGTSITVTGSRIRGAPVASPTISVDREAIIASGQTGLAEVARNLPQSFGGGQNLGVGANVGSANGINVGGAATINLRGLGSDATLTLLNGHRLAYNGSRQGVDVSAIPLGAVDRLEVVADGASALYGSDAVAGVANIILRRDFEGLTVDLDGGLATQGGYSRQRVAATTGAKWRSGGIIASYEYARSTSLRSDERDFARSRPGVIIFPPTERHAIVLSGHQELTERLSFAADLLFNRRRTEIGFPDNPAGDLSVSRTEQPSTSRSFAVAPSLTLELPGGWRGALSGVYGKERVFTRANNFVGQTLIRSTPLCYCNDGKSFELAADGGLFDLGGGTARAALGAGYRSNLLNADRGPGNVANVRRSQDSYYAYGELNVPLASPFQGRKGLYRLNLSAALRYERYPGIDEVVTPKLGQPVDCR
ncbi:TonB-dependent receptor [Sphingobium aromaticiconvertens]|uniref:TonB-dependent receptor n=1 Tax=Sphingobium aromaticiconvertens TaxID=365341 RepID=UPI00301AF5D0